VKLEIQRVNLLLKEEWQIARTNPINARSVVIVKVTGSDGSIGFGESSPVARYRESVESVESFLTAVNTSSISPAIICESDRYLESLMPGNYSAKCALNVALADAAAKAAEQPLHQFLNLGFREGQHVTSFTISLDTSANPPEIWIPVFFTGFGFIGLFFIGLILRSQNEILLRERRTQWVRELVEKEVTNA
jgi:L-alanine-DL-glutamate epimerase-like enolase superfamily enzyme